MLHQLPGLPAELAAARLQAGAVQPRGSRKGVASGGSHEPLFASNAVRHGFRKQGTVSGEVQGFFIGFGKAQANKWVKRLTAIVNSALGYELQLPARGETMLAACPGLTFIIDGTERPIQGPQDQERQQQHYSGKKKRHTVKNLVISDKQTKKLKVLSRTCEGKKHDKTLADEENYRFPRNSKLYKDTGFQGYDPTAIRTYQPKKKPRGGALTPEEKAQNQAISKERSGVEHAIGGAKVYRIVRDTLRGHLATFAYAVMEIACGLHNLRLDHRSLVIT